MVKNIHSLIWIQNDAYTWELIKIRSIYLINESTVLKIFSKLVVGTKLSISVSITPTSTSLVLTEGRFINIDASQRIPILAEVLSYLIHRLNRS